MGFPGGKEEEKRTAATSTVDSVAVAANDAFAHHLAVDVGGVVGVDVARAAAAM